VPYRIDVSQGAAFAEERGIDVTPPLAGFMQPCRLNPDETIDYAGGDWEFSSTRVLPVPVHTTAASTNGGETMHTLRSQSYSPQTLFVDFDGDDRLDLVAESSGLFRGGLRESLNRYTSDRVIDHEIAIYLQSINGEFADEPAVKAAFNVELERVPFQQAEMLRRYQSSELFNLTGDFNGDDRNDFVVRDTVGRVVVYLSTQDGRTTVPDAEIKVDAPVWRFGVADVNLDGLADVLVHRGGAPEGATAVYLTQGAAR
jgi:hypothetical protein